ncbi:acyl-CoA thioesterase [Acinetobacter populi]|uniref:Thioesterase n=1 Tax=Acinetobacter populi TaxID=1582270 RepID=A0A1Z9YZ91_9GAMM|nr:thioesterase family protein [Acinetobacter populi]OUY07482.1 thioesterase [Acinetobacter populi]
MNEPILSRSAFNYFNLITTRWADNDIYGHVNNVMYYSFFDTAVNTFLIQQADLDIHHGKIIGLVVDSSCRYFAPLAYPEQITAGVRVLHIGNRSVKYQIALFKQDEQHASAQGHFVHVYVDRDTRKPTPITDHMRQALQTLSINI